VGVFPEEEKVEQKVPGGPQAPSYEELNLRLSKASPGAYRSYIMNNVSCCAYLCMWSLCTTCRVLFGDVIGCIVVPFHMYPCCRCITFIRLDVLCLVDSHR
jgi:hypothetical protein